MRFRCTFDAPSMHFQRTSNALSPHFQSCLPGFSSRDLIEPFRAALSGIPSGNTSEILSETLSVTVPETSTRLLSCASRRICRHFINLPWLSLKARHRVGRCRVIRCTPEGADLNFDNTTQVADRIPVRSYVEEASAYPVRHPGE